MNADRKRESDARYQRVNRDRVLERVRTWKAANPSKVRAYAQQDLKNNRARFVAQTAKRRAAQRNAVPSWADADLVADIYAYATIMRAHGVDCQVDHVVPLNSDLVCGLHTPANLTVLGRIENQSKNNRHWPQMP